MRGDGFVTRATRAQWHAQTGHLFPADPTPLPTPGEVEGMRQRHQPEVVDGLHYCVTCETSAPCDADRLLALVDMHAADLGHARSAGGSYRRQRDALRDRLDAVLAECDRTDDYEHRRSLTLGTLVDRIRRAATGEAT